MENYRIADELLLVAVQDLIVYFNTQNLTTEHLRDDPCMISAIKDLAKEIGTIKRKILEMEEWS